MLARIFACQPAEPGTAQLMVRLRGEQVLLSDLTFILCNNEQNYLQPDGRWGSVQHWFTINSGYPLANGSGFRIGPALLDPLLVNTSQVQIQVKLPSGETRNTTLQLMRDELFSSDARGQTGDYSDSSVLITPPSDPKPATTPTIEPVEQPEQVPLPPLTAAEEPRRKRGFSFIPMLIGGLLVLLIAAGALWWLFGRDTGTQPPTTVEKPQETTPPVATAPPATPDASAEKPAANECIAANLTRLNELDFVQSCVQQKLGSDTLLTIIRAAKDAKKCGVAQRLYANRAQGGDIQIALVYASEYDPNNHQPSECFKEADKDTAVYWYETVLQFEPNNSKAKQRLEELKK